MQTDRTVRVEIPEERTEALRRYRRDPLFHEIIQIAGRSSGYSKNQLLNGEACREIVVPAFLVGLSG